MSQYTIRRVAPTRYRIVKFDDLMNVEAIYVLTEHRSGFSCNCPQSSRSNRCRHIDILSLFVSQRRVDSGWFYDFDLKLWDRPILDAVRRLK